MSSNTSDVKESKILNDILGRQAEQEVAAAKVEGSEVRYLLHPMSKKLYG
jgi:hypothetical protein